MFPEWTVTNEAQADTPHWAIIAKAEEWKPDLMVVGSHGRSALGRAILGSVSQKVLYETECSVRIARGKSEKSADDCRSPYSRHGRLARCGCDDWTWLHRANGSRELKSNSLPPSKLSSIRRRTGRAVKPRPRYSNRRRRKINRRRTYRFADDNRRRSEIFSRPAGRTVGSRLHFSRRERTSFSRTLFIGSVSSSVAARAHCSVEVVRRKKLTEIWK